MKGLTLRKRAVATVTLYAFTLTTVAPSLAWATESAAPAQQAAGAITAHGATPAVTDVSTARAVDEVPAADLEASREKAAMAANSSSKDTATATKEKASKEQLQDALQSGTGTPPQKASAVSTDVQQGDQALALPTGGDKSGVTSQAISTPKGEGKIQGMGESFSAQLSTGIATFSVPFSLPGARGGAQPSLGLEYSSASGAGLAGMGWSVGVPYIARQTDRGLPKYDDRADWHPNQDRFVFNGGQELVPICLVSAAATCTGALANEQFPAWAAGSQYFRPRVEGSFLRFFWSPDHRTWRVQDKSGVTMELGVPLDGGTDAAHASGLETDPRNPSHIFRWHLARQYDPHCAGSANCDTQALPKPLNVVVYKYFQDNGQAYLSDIYDTTPPNPVANAWDTSNLDKLAHHTHLNYEQRPDPTETYHSGWLIRQTQRLAGVDVTSKPTLGPASARRQVRRYHLSYDTSYHTSYLTSVQVEGRCAGSETDPSVPAESGGFLGATSCERLPPMTFGYSHTEGYSTSGGRNTSRLPGYEEVDARLRQVGNSPPRSIDDPLTNYFDINSDGLPDVLVTAPGVYADYGIFFNSARGVRDTFASVTQMTVNGVLGANAGSIMLSNPNVVPLDADGDGIIDLFHTPLTKRYGIYHPQFLNGTWRLNGAVVPAADQQSVKIDFTSEQRPTRVVDANFDGLVDVVISTGQEYQTFLNLGRLPNGNMQFGHGSWAGSDTSNISYDPIEKCLPDASGAADFGSPDIFFADMNGDGIQDVVRVRAQTDVLYWPGRGNGFWGTGALDDCPGNSHGVGREVRMGKLNDLILIADQQAVRLDDVNGDGLDDIVQVRNNAVDIWLNIDGHGWTDRFIIDQTPASPSFANKVRLVDLNGSGTRDIAWGQGKRDALNPAPGYQYMDLAGGDQPGLLVHVENGLGKSTDLEYSTSTEEMLAAERIGGDCGGDTGPFDSPWCSKSPVVTHVVKRVTEHDNLDKLGLPSGNYTTEYSYRDPLYEGRQREFRGFKRARSKRIGDVNSPSDFTESTFLLGECEDETATNGVDECSLSERWRDNPREALKGLPVVTERYDERGVKLSTALTTYRLRQLYMGRDARAVRHAFQSSSKSIAYDTALGSVGNQAATTFNAVELEGSYPLTPVGQHPVGYALAAGSGSATTEGSSAVDGFGNALTSIDRGCTDCSPSDEVISKVTTPKFIDSWTQRTETSYVTGNTHTDHRGETKTTFDAFGAPVSSQANLFGTVAIDRFHESGAARQIQATPPTTASVDGWRVMGTTTYDDFGNVTRQKGPTGDANTPTDLLLCRDVSYDANDGYAQLPLSETTYTGGCGVGGLTTVAVYDRSLGVVTQVVDLNNQRTTVAYDGFGRLTSLTRPPAVCTSHPLESVKVEYNLPTNGSERPYSYIHTYAQNGADECVNSYQESYSFVDGMGRARVGLTQADTSAGDEKPWIVSSVADFDAKGAVRRKYLPFFFDGNPSVFPLTGPPTTQYGRQRYDAFGRQLQTFDVDGTVTLQSRYHALSTDLWDAADFYPGPHQASFASTRTDGHGRTVETTERVHVSGVLEKRYVRMQYLATGEVEVITRIRENDAANAVTRWMRYDSLGRLVLNVDPHTTGNFTTTLTVSAVPSTNGLKAWRYVYDDAGNLVATSDARGCGQNFYYDGAGRLFGEDYSPCMNNHPLYTPLSVTSTSRSNPAALTSTNGFEVFYQYDASSSQAAPPPSDLAYSTANLKGRLAAVQDRATSTWFSYDIRGRGTATFRRVVASGSGGNTVISSRYAPRWYKKTSSYDAADRPVTESTGAQSTSLLVNGKSDVKTTYTKRGTVASVDSSYGKLVNSVKHDATGLMSELVFGDVAGTTTTMSYDSRRRLRNVQTARPGSAWTSPPASYQPPPQNGSGAAPTTLQLILQDLDYSYDVVGNPTEIRDWRTPEEWPAGSKPTTRRMEYDDLNRVTRVDYEYPGGWDKSVSPFATEIAGTQTDPRIPVPRNQKLLSTRPAWQTYKYDWLGNQTSTDDDQHAFYERSLGTLTNNTTGKPYQVTAGSQSPSGGANNGSFNTVTYDAAGNLTHVSLLEKTAACTTVLSSCTSALSYYWDEVGRLLQARRIDANVTGNNLVYVNYSYDANDERILKTSDRSGAHTAGQYNDTLYIFDSLEIRRTAFDSASGEYPLNDTNEVPYLDAHGMRLGRVVKEPSAFGEPRSPSTNPVHVFMELPDHLGSASIVIDRDTSELVEARTYQPFGAEESDYRPDRWKGFREDYGFTGKEEDVEVGVQYFGKRFFSPYLGRWLSPDPLAVHSPGSADLNLYAYVAGAVLKAVDPTGLCPDNQSCDPEQEFAAAQDCGNRSCSGGEVQDKMRTLITRESPEARQGAVPDRNLEPLPEDTLGLMVVGGIVNTVKNLTAVTEEKQVLNNNGDPITVRVPPDPAKKAVAFTQVALLFVPAAEAESVVGDAITGSTGPPLTLADAGIDTASLPIPVRQLSTDGVRVTTRGVDVVEQHVARFGPDEANSIMIQRLRAAASGEAPATATDLNFYTHELREFVRYRAAGWTTGVPAHWQDARNLWLQSHAPTLVEYGLPIRGAESEPLLLDEAALKALRKNND